MSTPLFPLLPSLQSGFRHLAADWPFISRLIAFPILIGFASFVALDLLQLANGVLWAGVFRVPGDFVKGIFLALYVRYLLFKETPLQAAQSADSQRDLATSTLLYTAISFAFSGLMAGLAMVYGRLDPAQAQTPVAMVSSIAGLTAVIWLFRYQWLPIGAAAGYPVRSFIKFLGTGFALPVRILALWLLGSLPSVLILGFCGEIVRVIGGFNSLPEISGPAGWLFYLINSAVSVVTAAILAAASVHAIKHCMKENTNV